MNNLSLLTKQVNLKLEKQPLFYVSNDPERAVGLEKLLENYHIVCVDDGDIYGLMKLEHRDIFSIEHERKELNGLYRNSAKLLEEPETQLYIDRKSGRFKYYQTFKISPRFERLAERDNATLINTASRLNRMFENKLSQFEKLSPHGVNFPHTKLIKFSEVNYKKLKKEFGESFVVQFDRGHTGQSTKFVNSKEDFEEVSRDYPDRIVRISELIEGEAYTVKACITRNHVYVGGLNYQITGIASLTNFKGGTVGNDFKMRKGVDDKMRKSIISEVIRIGKIMHADGFRGLFGVDFVVDDEPYVIEVNARQQASIPFYTKLQLMLGEVPLSLIHLAEFLKIDVDIDPEEYSLKNTEPIGASQIFLRNTSAEPFLVNGRIKSGVYRLQSDNAARVFKEDDYDIKPGTIYLDEERDRPLVFQNPGYSIEDIKSGGFLLLAQLKGKRINPGNEIARVQALQSILDSDGQPLPWVLETLSAVKRYLE